MKIAVIAGHYIPEFGYQEVYLARAFARSGHEVCVFTSPVVPKAYRNKVVNRNYSEGIEYNKEFGITIRRLRIVFSVGLWVYSRQLKQAVLDYYPDIIFILAMGKLFPLPVLNIKNENLRKYTVLGNNFDFFNWQSLKSKISSFGDILKNKLIRNHLYRKAVKESDLLFSYTDETDIIMRKMLNKKLKEIYNHKLRKISLGFDPRQYYFDEPSFYEIRNKYSIPENAFVFATSTRVNENKRLDLVLNSLSELQKSGKEFYYLIVGFQGKSYDSKLKDLIKEKDIFNRVICVDFSDHDTLRKIFCASDAGIWIKPAISILEAMGTGLKIILPNKPGMNHLLASGKNGYYFNPDEMTKIMTRVIEDHESMNISTRLQLRENTAGFNFREFSYDVIARKCLVN